MLVSHFYHLCFGVDWTVWDKNQLKVLLASEKAPFTKIAYKRLGSNRVIVQRLQNELTQSLILGEGIPGIAKRVKAVTGISHRQAVTIARTETLRTANQGRMLGYHQAANDYGIEMLKEWRHGGWAVTAPRDDHLAMHEVTAELDEDFILPDGTHMSQPLDPNAPAMHVVNCHCVVVSLLKGYSKHFVERYFGSVEDRRDGVSLDKIKEALKNDKQPKISQNGNSSKYITAGAAVSLNPKTGNLIQASPLSKKRRQA